MSTTDQILSHLAGEAAAREFLKKTVSDFPDVDALWSLLAGLPQSQRRGACRVIQKALERAGRAA